MVLSLRYAVWESYHSTPYLYAQELIGKDRGILVKFADSQSIKDALFRVLENSAYFRQMKKRSEVWC